MARQLTAQVVVRDDEGRLVFQGSAPLVDGIIHVGPVPDAAAAGGSSSAPAAGASSSHADALAKLTAGQR